MNIHDLFPSKYIKASDLNGQDLDLVIEEVVLETVGGEELPIVYFEGAQKILVLKPTNGRTIASIYGPETDNWIGQSITLDHRLVAK